MTTFTTIDNWDDISWRHAELDVFHVQRRIFNASRRGDRATVHTLQDLLVRSFGAKYIAVRKVAQRSRGRHTPGIDGISSLTKPQRLRLAKTLSIRDRPLPLLRKLIPKNGGPDIRPLAIPTIADRARQALIALALEPQWEGHLSPHMYGFRRGRSAHDAIAHIRLHIQRSPKWVLDADIEAFFDNVDHAALLDKLDSSPALSGAIGRMLNAGIFEGRAWTFSDTGIPQGGPLSPILANICLAGMEENLIQAFPPARKIGGQRVGKAPRLVIYADDLLVFHDEHEVILETRDFLTKWLANFGLHFNEKKTRTMHTLERNPGDPGLEFLGFCIRQRRVGRHQVKAWFKGVYTWITPSRKATKAFRAKVSKILAETRPNPKMNAAYAHQREKGRPSHQELLIHQLNRVLRGWANYFRSVNSKKSFSILDNWTFQKLWRWSIRHYGKLGRRRLVRRLFNGGKPWSFKVPNPSSDKEVELYKLASTRIWRHTPVKADRSFYDGDASYWMSRLGRYPGFQTWAAKAIRRQFGKCPLCGGKTTTGQRLAGIHLTAHKGISPKMGTVVHTSCADSTEFAPFRWPVGLGGRDRP